MTEFITTQSWNSQYYPGVISKCNENCFEPVTTQLLYQLASGIPMNYSCEYLGSANNISTCPSIDTSTYNSCDNTFDCYKTRLATCKTEICISAIPLLFTGPAMSDFPSRFHTSFIYYQSYYSNPQYKLETVIRDSRPYSNILNLHIFCSDDNNAITRHIDQYRPLRFYDIEECLSECEYEFQSIIETYTIDIEVYKPSYTCGENLSLPNNIDLPFGGLYPDKSYTYVPYCSPNPTCSKTVVCGSSPPAFFPPVGSGWVEIDSNIVSIIKHYPKSSCDSPCQTCTPSGSCWPELPYPITSQDMLFEKTVIDPKCCSLLTKQGGESSSVNNNPWTHFSANTSFAYIDKYRMRSQKCKEVTYDDYMCSDAWKNSCFDQIIEQYPEKYIEATCSSDACNKFNYSKDLDKIKYSKKLNETLEETITSENKFFSKESTASDTINGYCGSYKQIKFTTKYVDEEIIETVPVTVYIVYCQKIPKTCR